MTDPTKHILAGLAVALIALPCYFGGSLFSGLWSALAGIVWGVGKEWYDYQNDGRFDWRDLGCTCLGVVIVCLFIVLMHVGKG